MSSDTKKPSQEKANKSDRADQPMASKGKQEGRSYQITVPFGMEPLDEETAKKQRGVIRPEGDTWQLVDDAPPPKSPEPSAEADTEQTASSGGRGTPNRTQLGMPPVVPDPSPEKSPPEETPSEEQPVTAPREEMSVAEPDGDVKETSPAEIEAPVKETPAKVIEKSSASKTHGSKRLKPLLAAILAISLGTMLLALAALLFFNLFHTEPKQTLAERSAEVTEVTPPRQPEPRAVMPRAARALVAPKPEPTPLPDPKRAPVVEPPKLPVPEPPTSVAPPAPPPEKSAAVSNPEGDTVRIIVAGIPRGTQVLVNGKMSKNRFTVPRSLKAIKVEARLPGYANAVKRVVPGQNKVVRIRMKKQ